MTQRTWGIMYRYQVFWRGMMIEKTAVTEWE
jgi:hypothetical protein